MNAVATPAPDPIRSRLRPGERVLWRGQPDVMAYSMRGAWYTIPFSIAWCAFAIFWEATVLTMGAGLFFSLWGLPFVAIGLYMVFGRILVARSEARRTHYALTEQRVLIVTGAFRPRIVEIALADLPPAQLEGDGSGVGTITFGTSTSVFRPPPGWPSAGMFPQPLAFASIDEPARVYLMLQEAKAATRQR